MLLTRQWLSVVDEELADLVWDAWDAGLISDELAMFAWMQIVTQV